MGLDTDTRGWIMTLVSGIACTVGASAICIDVIARNLPMRRFRNFKIQTSNAFLSASLSLSFGVMLFSALYGMLPQSKNYLIKAGFPATTASWILISCFLGGVVGIRVISGILHHYIPSHIVDCDHEHEDEHAHESASPDDTPEITERTSLLQNGDDLHKLRSARRPNGGIHRNPSLPARLQHSVSYVLTGSKESCDENGSCYGFTNPCGIQCRRISLFDDKGRALSVSSNTRRKSYGKIHAHPKHDVTIDEESHPNSSTTEVGSHSQDSGSSSRADASDLDSDVSPKAHHHHSDSEGEDLSSSQHHHHVPKNAFLSIGLQTSLAIALHKLPEGFITYATNHANPKLGFNVFLALFIHNLTEGFVLALPLYLAINSRFQAIIWSALLGGVSQPAGAGIAALWFHFAKGSQQPGEAIYGGMFAVTSGIMTSVGLSLFSESLTIHHSKELCILFAFLGMAILGISFALTA